MKENYRKWNVFTLIITGVVFGLLAVMVIVIDPYWHFHGPIEGVSYRLGNGRYMNDGILKNYEYDSVIIGTSMSENFKTSQWEELTGSSAVKVPFFGAYYKELHEALDRAYAYHGEIENVIWGLDYNQLFVDWDKEKYENNPVYLYDDTIWNDGNYLWNKTVLIRGALPDLLYSVVGKESATFDEYGAWEKTSGKAAVLTTYTPGESAGEQYAVTSQLRETIESNVQKNIESLVQKHPDTQFYFFFTPYSIAYWDDVYHKGNLDLQIEATRIFAEHLLAYENVKLYCFYDNYDLICDLNNYVDAGHYNASVNEKILQWIVAEEYLMTKENYEERIEQIGKYYKEFDYESFWKQ